MKILLIGGSGLVSSRVLRFAVEAGHEVLAVTRGETSLPEGCPFTHIKGDRNAEDLSYIADNYSYDAVLDVICRTPLHAKQSAGLAKNCRRLVMVSTDYVYEPEFRKLFLKECDAVFSTQADYGGNKRRAEEVILKAHSEGLIQGTILRPPHIYGPGSNPGTIPRHGRRPYLLDDIRAGKPLHLLEGGLGLIQPIHADDFARIVLTVIDKEASHGEAYNASGAELMTNLDYYKTIASVLGTTITHTTYTPEPGAPDVNYYVAGHRCYDMGKLDALLPDFTYTPFVEGIKEWVAHLSR